MTNTVADMSTIEFDAFIAHFDAVIAGDDYEYAHATNWAGEFIATYESVDTTGMSTVEAMVEDSIAAAAAEIVAANEYDDWTCGMCGSTVNDEVVCYQGTICDDGVFIGGEDGSVMFTRVEMEWIVWEIIEGRMSASDVPPVIVAAMFAYYAGEGFVDGTAFPGGYQEFFDAYNAPEEGSVEEVVAAPVEVVYDAFSGSIIDGIMWWYMSSFAFSHGDRVTFDGQTWHTVAYVDADDVVWFADGMAVSTNEDIFVWVEGFSEFGAAAEEECDAEHVERV